MNSGFAKTSSKAKKPLLEAGIVLNEKWEILQHIATGGKGEVYRAKQTNLNREVVVKTVSVDYLKELDDAQEADTEIQRFRREALAMAQIRHPYVVQVYDQDAADIVKNGEKITVQYVVMEYVPGGRTLRDTMPNEGYKDKVRDLRQWIQTYFLPMFDGLETVHALGIVHRDMKPENVLLDGSTPKIVDFGIAGGPQWVQLTKSHHVEGTITYMAPEQFLDLGETDGRADVYALGKMLYEVTEGRMVDSKTACPLRGVCISNPSTTFLKELDHIVQQATAEDKEKRTPSVGALREQLERMLEKAEAAEAPLFRSLHRRQLIAVGVVLFVIVVASNIYHHLIMIHESSLPGAHTPGPEISESDLGTSLNSGASHSGVSPISILAGRDGSTMRLVPAGQVKLPSYVGIEGGKTFEVHSFYLDETEVTNYKYLEFLNQVVSRIKVKDGTVYGDEQPWMLLGPVYGGYEPIVFHNGRFLLQDETLASRPVVKVTGYGAAAYAAFYDARLPTEMEWLRSAGRPRTALLRNQPKHVTEGSADTANTNEQLKRKIQKFNPKEFSTSDISTDRVPANSSSGEDLSQSEKTPDSFGSASASSVPYPVLNFHPNMDGIRGLTGNVSEWGVRGELKTNSKNQFVVLGGTRGSMLIGSTLLPGIAQDPEIGFEDVGFRCAKSVRESDK